MAHHERIAVENALRQTRLEWLPILEQLALHAEDRVQLAMLYAEIKRLRRLLGIKAVTKQTTKLPPIAAE